MAHAAKSELRITFFNFLVVLFYDILDFIAECTFYLMWLSNATTHCIFIVLIMNFFI